MKRIYHNHGPADACGPVCPRYSSPDGTWLQFGASFRTDNFTPAMLDAEALARAVAAELVRQTGAAVRKADFESIELTVIPPPVRIGRVTTESLERYHTADTRRGW